MRTYANTKWIASAIFAATFGTPAFAGDGAPTFTKDVLPILQENCQNCHRPTGLNLGGMVAPMALMTYEDVRPWAKSIAKEVSNRNMPPWDASAEFNGHFANERTLTDEQIETIVRWVDTGAQRGRVEDAPQAIEFATYEHGWSLEEAPDMVLTFKEPVWVGDEVADWQPMIPVDIPAGTLTEDKWIRAVEFKPDTDIVHHIVGFEGGGMIGGIAPGSELDVLPEGYGMLLKKDAKLLMGMHYNKEAGPGTGQFDKSEMAIWFHDKPVTHDVRWRAALSMTFNIPPGDPNHVVDVSYTFEEDSLLLALSPHMHFRGKTALYKATYPDGTTENLIDVPRYDFNWQSHYTFKEPKRMPKGTKLDVAMVFDNSTGNPANPDPTAAVRWGLPTTDEMANAWFNYCNAEPFKEGEVRITESGTGGRNTPGGEF